MLFLASVPRCYYPQQSAHEVSLGITKDGITLYRRTLKHPATNTPLRKQRLSNAFLHAFFAALYLFLFLLGPFLFLCFVLHVLVARSRFQTLCDLGISVCCARLKALFSVCTRIQSNPNISSPTTAPVAPKLVDIGPPPQHPIRRPGQSPALVVVLQPSHSGDTITVGLGACPYALLLVTLAGKPGVCLPKTLKTLWTWCRPGSCPLRASHGPGASCQTSSKHPDWRG